MPPRQDRITEKLQDEINKRLEQLNTQVSFEETIGDLDRCRNDFEYYYKHIFLDVDDKQFPWGTHQEFAVRFITWPGSNGVFPTRRVLVMPPGTGKSNIISKAYASWLAGKHPDRPICLATSTTDLAMGRSIYLRELVANDPLWKSVFPGVEPWPQMWRTDEWVLARKDDQTRKGSAATFKATGAGSSIGGIRVWAGIVDDAHDVNNSRTHGERERIKDWYATQFLSRLSGMEGAHIIMLANIWHGDDLTVQLWNSGQYAVMHMQALYPTRETYCEVTLPHELAEAGPELADWCKVPREDWVWKPEDRLLRMVIHRKSRALWPEKIPRKELEQQRRLNHARFERVWNGNREMNKGTHYREELFRYWSLSKPPAIRTAQQSWDTASESTDRSDYTAGVLQYIGTDGDVYVAELFRDKVESGVALPLAITAWYWLARLRDIPVQVVLIEASAYARSSINQIRRGWPTDEFIKQAKRYMGYSDAVPALVKMLRQIIGEQDRLPDMLKVPLRPIKLTKAGKSEMHDDALAWYESGNVWHCQEMDGLSMLEREQKNYPGDAHDDAADCNAQGINFHFSVRKPRTDRPSAGHMMIDLSPVLAVRTRIAGLPVQRGL